MRLGNIEAPSPMLPLVQASSALAEALIDDPFYWAITDDIATSFTR
jgi:hypothetical protein